MWRMRVRECPWIRISNNACPQTRLRDLAAQFARGLLLIPYPPIRGRKESRVRAAPAVSCAKCTKKRTRAYRFSGGNPAFPAQWFYGLLRALPGDQACLTPSSALLLADLTPASGRQNDTTWPYASGRARLARCRVHRIPTRVRDVRETPLCGSGQGESVE